MNRAAMNGGRRVWLAICAALVACGELPVVIDPPASESEPRGSMTTSVLPLVPHAPVGGEVALPEPWGKPPLRECDAAEPARASTQAEIDALAGCVSLRSLDVEGALDLRPLRSLRRVLAPGISLIGIEALQGLEGLEEAGALSIQFGAAGGPADLRVLGALRRIERLSLTGSKNLRSLAGLENARGYQRIAFKNNSALQSLAGLTLDSSEMGEVTIESNPLLSNIDALRPITTIRSRLFLQQTALQNLNALENLSVAAGIRIAVLENPLLADITGLARVRSAGLIDIASNPLLTRLPEFAELTDLGTLQLNLNAAVTTAPSFPRVVSLAGMIVNGNPALTSITGFPALESADFVRIVNNGALRQIELSRLRTASSALIITHNPALDGAALNAALAGVASDKHRVAPDQAPLQLDPCPWIADSECDFDLCAPGTDPACPSAPEE